eukprot:CAMPEP_0198142698 /NCGR_PEP_ID=MMETSP1443-20131203/5426_1 /TAXON_ID=186043 /ORGANISM="Entomoneis sp., Strain CCMP2396" /LENGTH=284 /DNA_ID=CAMNT_0043805775 /DNA_START=139 /DNA_END=993 /DNA_ORIENTATION=+
MVLSSKRQSMMEVSPEEERQISGMLLEMTEDEIEVAARASQDYFSQPNAAFTTVFAKLYALRFLRAKDGDQKKALSRMQDTIRFRKEINVDGLRKAFDKDGNTDYAMRLEKDLAPRHLYVQGYDTEGRSTYIFVPRNVQGHDVEWTIKQHVYTLERAIASSRARDKTVNAVVDFKGFSLRHAPPTHIGKAFMATFRNHYAGAINNIFLVDAPSSFSFLWNIFKPLVGTKTRNKIHFVKSRKNELSKFCFTNQAAFALMHCGEQNGILDMDEYLHEIPFCEGFRV